MCIMMARLRPMTFSPTGMPACLRASSRQSNAARSCAKHDPERNVLGCSQTLKNDTLTHPSLWADHSIKTGEPEGLQQRLQLQKDLILATPEDIRQDCSGGVIDRMPQPPLVFLFPDKAPHFIHLGFPGA